MTKKKAPSLRSIAKKYNTNVETISRIKKEGIDVNDPNQLIPRLSALPNWQPPKDLEFTEPKAGNPANDANKGLQAAIERLRQAELDAYQAYQDSPPNLSLTYLKSWNVILEQLRKIEESNPDIEKAKANTITKEELSEVLGHLFKDLRQDLEALESRISTIGQNTNKEELAKIVRNETCRIIDNLSNWKGFDE